MVNSMDLDNDIFFLILKLQIKKNICVMININRLTLLT